MYIFFIGLVAAPLVQIASIGTQITEAFAGLDRIREIRDTWREDADDAVAHPLPELDGDVAFEDVSFEYVPDVPVLRNVSFHAPRGIDDGAGRLERGGEEHADRSRDGVQPAVAGPSAASMGATWPLCGCTTTGRTLGVVMQDNFLFDGTIRENIAYSRPDGDRRRDARRRAHRARGRVRRQVRRSSTTRSSASAA